MARIHHVAGWRRSARCPSKWKPPSAGYRQRPGSGGLPSHARTRPILRCGAVTRPTGYLPKTEFEEVADQFFARPEESVRGWERAADAQRRIVAAVERIMPTAVSNGDTAVIPHGGVGALLLCHLKRIPVSRTEDHPGNGGGNVFSFDTESRFPSGWRRIEDEWKG
ncbi:histidine phosphatase family protein [Rhodovastum atsumiense]|uniref:histidine phosphatase family protein n=1 Tax=Rhodovastum atsumiense TaxID=504468 RepID=UPI0030B8F48E